MKLEVNEYNTDINGYEYTIIAAVTEDGNDIAFELIVSPSEYNGRKPLHYSVIDECINDYGVDEIKSLRKYDTDGTVHIYGI